ncbi:PE-PGRS family protein [Streptomyces phaeofaciens]|uniref:PE-PGRS family protein n=1 Tax=Streptomyces phaeofaciens TaxID=68254 RepID=UPI00367FA69D
MDGQELKALLGRAGLEPAEHWRHEEVPPARAAWRHLASAPATPAVRGGRAAEVNEAWHRLAVAHGLFDEDGTFLIDVEGDRPACRPRMWTRVRLTAGWDLAGVLGERPGPQPEFVTMPVGGDTVLGVRADPDGVRVTVVDRIADRVEAAARAAGEETPREREAAWESLFEEPSASRRLRALWADGLGGNPAAPDELRIALLDRSDHPTYRPQSAAVVEAAMAHESWNVRGGLAEYQPNLTPEQLARMILAEDDPGHRLSLVWKARHRRAELPAPVYERLAADPSAPVREVVAGLPGLPAARLTALAADSHASVRAAACGPAWPQLAAGARKKLLDDPDGTVRTAALLRHHEDQPMPRSLFEAEGFTVDGVENCRLEPELAEWLRRAFPDRRRSLARNPHLHREVVLQLAGDPDDAVRFQASVHPVLTEEERARVDFPLDDGFLRHDLEWVKDLHDDPDALRRLAASAHPAVRRSVARARRLPADVVERLARDEDRVVHLFLAESCEEAPAELLLSVWRWWTGSFSHPDVPHGHPRFPRRDLLRYADDPSPRMRRLALDDPDSTAELVERFGRDPSEEVRRRAASDPRLSAASAVRLLSDPYEGVRYAAGQHPRLPARTLVGLLRDAETAQDAARHPALPVAVMRRMAGEAREGGAG